MDRRRLTMNFACGKEVVIGGVGEGSESLVIDWTSERAILRRKMARPMANPLTSTMRRLPCRLFRASAVLPRMRDFVGGIALAGPRSP